MNIMSDQKITLKSARRPVRTLTVIIILMFALLLWGFNSYRRDVSELVQYFNVLSPVAVTLHREHFLNDPASLHVLWWHQERPSVPGIIVHNLFVPDEEAEHKWSGSGMQRTIEEYNRISLAQACYLAQRGERSERLKSIFMLAKVLYQTEPEKSLASGYVSFDENASAETAFANCWNDINRMPLYQDYLSRVILPKAEIWETKASAAVNGRDATSD